MTVPAKDISPAHVLVVEDSSVFREMQGLLLRQAGYAVSLHESPQSALTLAAKQHFDLVVIDYELPEMNGEQFMHALRKLQPDIAVIFVSGSLTIDLAIKLSSQGVAGIFNKPANPKTLLEKINETLARNAARDTAARVGSGSPVPPPRRPSSGSPFTNASSSTEPAADRLAYAPRFVVGSSDRFREFTHRLWKVRDFRAVLLLHGEAGSPFELLARELAEISIFRDGPIMVCDAAKFEPRGLIEVLAPSLLSHDAGTLVVTGVETFSTEQQKTLENLVTGRDVFLPFARRFRLVLAATSALSDRVDEGNFGETLYYKVSALSLAVPTLREMRTDIVANAERILELCREAGDADAPTKIAADAAQWIATQDWPGNYDELTRTILNAVRCSDSDELTLVALDSSWSDKLSAPTASPEANSTIAAAATAQPPTTNARPPFPIASDIPAAPPVREQSAVAAAAPPEPVAMTATTAVASAPAGQLFARSSPTTQPLTAKSLFRPAAASYNFGKRLSETLAGADAAAAH